MIKRIKVEFTRTLHLPRFTVNKGMTWEVRVDRLQKEGFSLFEELLDSIREETLGTLFRIQVARRGPEEDSRKKKKTLQMNHGGDAPEVATVKRKGQKVGRNAPCPCGSGRKYKKCCGANK